MAIAIAKRCCVCEALARVRASAQIAKRTSDFTTPTEQDNNKLLTIFVSPHQDLRHKFSCRVCFLKAER
jgi:hypothetical protein